jgi:uncharacterized protein YaeQ
MARGASILQFEVAVSDVDRGVYDTLTLQVAQHPSESDEYVVARVLAYALEYEDGIGFTAGLSSGEVPAIEVRDMTGRQRAWIEVGTPGGPRLHKASKAADRVAVYCHKPPEPWLKVLARERVHDCENIKLVALDPTLIGQAAEGLERRNSWSLSVVEGAVYLQVGQASLEMQLRPLGWPQG